MTPGAIRLAFRLLVLGGARSGKSRYALARAQARGDERILIATAVAGDAEMAARIARHRMERGPGWRVVEEPRDLAGALGRETAANRVVLVDCLTLWLTNVMLAGADVEAESESLAGVLARLAGPVILVSNEVGLGLVPTTPLGRAFRDAQGRLNQIVAAGADEVVFLAAGLPLTLKAPI